MKRSECVVESQKDLSVKAVGHHAVGRPDGLTVESLGVCPRKDSTVTEAVKELGKLEVVSIDGVLPVEINESTSRSTNPRCQPESTSGKNPAKAAVSTVSPGRTRENAGFTIPDCQTLMTDIHVNGKESPDTTGGTGERAHGQDRAGPLLSPGNLCAASQDNSKMEGEGEIWEDEDHRAPIELFVEELKTPKTGSGTDSGEVTAATWAYYGDMHAVLGARPSIEPPVLIASCHEDPTQTLMFLESVMDKDYILAKKLCQMILIYEPDNPEAKQFIPLIEEKLLLVGQEEEDEDEDEDEESSSDSEDSSDSGSSKEESSESSDSSSSSEQEEEEKEK